MTRMCAASALVMSVWLAAGCFNPSFGAISCGIGGACPSGLTCADDGFCRDPDVVVDGAVFDASAADAAPADAIEPGNFNVAHVPAGGSIAGTSDLMITGDVTIDTTDPTVFGMLVGISFDVWPQESGDGPNLAVLHVNSFTVQAGVTLTVIGDNAFVIISREVIRIEGLIDASATRNSPGVAGSAADAGSGAGGTGAHVATFADGGGGGGGYGSPGGAGGDGDTAVGGTGGSFYGDSQITTLWGGSGGGSMDDPTSCVRPPGAGGGAVQLTSFVEITIASSGGIHTGGGGGGQGRFGLGCNWGSGTGGGSGGTVYLQAPMVSMEGLIAANGGGGGGSANTGGNGANGEDGLWDTGDAAGANAGAIGGGPDVGSDGGDGASGSKAEEPGDSNLTANANGGGGGGGLGRVGIRLHGGALTGSGDFSPAPNVESL